MEFRVEAELAGRLREKGFRATFGRMALLEALEKTKKPMSAETLAKKLARKADQASVYRALEAFNKAGIVRRADVGHRHMHYELAAPRKHHHHYVCADCGARAIHV